MITILRWIRGGVEDDCEDEDTEQKSVCVNLVEILDFSKFQSLNGKKVKLIPKLL